MNIILCLQKMTNKDNNNNNSRFLPLLPLSVLCDLTRVIWVNPLPPPPGPSSHSHFLSPALPLFPSLLQGPHNLGPLIDPFLWIPLFSTKKLLFLHVKDGFYILT